MLSKHKKRTIGAGVAGTALLTASAIAAIVAFSDPEKLSENKSASKTKLVRLGNGWLVSTYGDTVPGAENVYDTKADAVRTARDIFVKTCNPATSESNCSLAADWSAPVNVSNTAGLSSISTDWQEDNAEGTITPFYGDSGKPNIFNAGSFAVVTWVDKYCEGGAQRMISYTARDGVTVPFSCTYAAYTDNVGSGVWTTHQLTDGSRDAKSDANKGLSVDTGEGYIANWAISWQEDPHGLQLGGASGPGDGASGASVTHGTDVWYTHTEDLMNAMGTGVGPWEAPVRITDNYTNDGAGGNTSPVFHPDDPVNEIVDLERGNTGASRPNIMLVGGSNPATTVIAYEESKGADRTDSGKFIRYHEFPFNSPPPSMSQYENGEPGCVISAPLENSRRVRFVSQPTASPNGLRMGVFWRQGLPTEGGPGDIMTRVGIQTADTESTGLRPEDMVPAVDPACRTSLYAEAKVLTTTPGSNLSSNTIPWSPVVCDACAVAAMSAAVVPTNNLTDTTSLNPYEDAKAHRAAIVGDDFYLGYSYARDWALATFTDLDNYNFWLRRYNAANGGSWTEAQNISNIDNVKTHVKEPRLVKTPGTNLTKCPNPVDPADPVNSDPEQCQNKNTLIVGWGTESNVYSHVESSEEFDIYYSRTTDKGLTYEPAVVVPLLGINNRFESQLRPSPSGNTIWTVWNEADNTAIGGTHAMLSVSDGSGATPPPPPPQTPPTAVNDTSSVACGSGVTIDVLGNDTDPDAGDVLTVTGFTQPANGTVTAGSVDGELIYTSDGLACGINDTFTYSISDGNGGEDSATVIVAVIEEETGYDLAISSLNVPETAKLFTGSLQNSSVTITNNGPEAVLSGSVSVVGVSSSVTGSSSEFEFYFANLAIGETKTFNFNWTPFNISGFNIGSTIDWTATVTPTVDDNDATNNTHSAVTTVEYP